MNTSATYVGGLFGVHKKGEKKKMDYEQKQQIVKKSIARKVTAHTVLAAYSTVDYGVSPVVTENLRADINELEQLEESPLVNAAKALVNIAIMHSISPSTSTHTAARNARDTLGDLLINTKEVKG